MNIILLPFCKICDKMYRNKLKTMKELTMEIIEDYHR